MNVIRRSKYGFTLVELLMVMVVLSVIAAIVIPKFADRNKQAKETALRQDLHLIRQGNEAMKADTGVYCFVPSDLASTTAPAKGYVDAGIGNSWVTAPINPTDWHGPYVSTVPNDPITGTAFKWDSVNTQAGNALYSTSTGTGLDGTAYNTW